MQTMMAWYITFPKQVWIIKQANSRMQPPYKQTNTDQQDEQTLLFQYTLFAYPQTKFRKTPTKLRKRIW